MKEKLDPITKNLINQLKERRIRGIKKYGKTTDQFNLGIIPWLQHLQEELLDGAVYIERLKQEFKRKEKTVAGNNLDTKRAGHEKIN